MARRGLGGAGRSICSRSFPPASNDSRGNHSGGQRQVVPRRPGIRRRPSTASSSRIRRWRSRRRFSRAESASSRPLPKRSSRAWARRGRPTGDCFGRCRWSAKLARSGALVRSEEGFGWANGAWPADFTIPAHMQAAIQEQWDSAAAISYGPGMCGVRLRRPRVPRQRAGRRPGHARASTCLIVLDEIERNDGHDSRRSGSRRRVCLPFVLSAGGDSRPAGHSGTRPAASRRPADRPRVPRPAGRRSGSCPEDFREHAL